MTNDLQNPEPQQEPSVLDYFKSLFRFGKETPAISDQPIAIGRETLAVSQSDADQTSDIQQSSFSILHSNAFPWRSLLAMFFALIGQRAFEPPPTTTPLGYMFYITAFALLGWAMYRGEWTLASFKPSSDDNKPLTLGENTDALIRGIMLLASIILAFVAFMMFGDNLFKPLNTSLWVAAIFFFMAALWERKDHFDGWNIRFNAWTIVLILATGLIFFFRFYHTQTVPPEPFSDHAEKLYDVYDVSTGITRVFFPRNTGREAIQMYWTLLISNVFGTGLSFLSLKLGTAILGFLTLPFVYLLGKEIGGQRVGLFAFLLTGIGYWPNVISRVGLRFPLYPLFVAPTLYFLIRGLRTRNRNYFLLSGFFLGLGLHGYSPIRIMPFVVIAAFALYWLHSQSKGARNNVIIWLALLGLTSLVVFIPLFRYWIGHPAEFGFRAFSRMSSMETPLPAPASEIFFSNLWKALKMFNFDDGEIWVHSVPHRPALDVVSAALFSIGVILVFVRYLRDRHWLDLYLLVSIPLLQLPSTLSLAYPGENPALNRAGGAYIPAFIIGAMAFDGLLSSFQGGRMRNILMWVVAGLLFTASAFQNYDLVFNQYYTLFRNSSWNTSDMGQVIKDFERDYGRTDTIWVVPYPHWVDTRLPAAWAGIPNRDLALWPDNLASSLDFIGPKLFIVRANLDDPQFDDSDTVTTLQSLYPNGQLRLFDSDVPGHDFWIFLVLN